MFKNVTPEKGRHAETAHPTRHRIRSETNGTAKWGHLRVGGLVTLRGACFP